MTTYLSDGGRHSNIFKVITKKPNKRSNYRAVKIQFVILLLKYLELGLKSGSLFFSLGHR